MNAPIIWCRYEKTSGGYIPCVIGGNAIADSTGNTSFVAGVFGNCFSTPATMTGVALINHTVSDSGSFSFWIKPSGWSCTNGIYGSAMSVMGYGYGSQNMGIQLGHPYIWLGIGGSRYLYMQCTGLDLTDGVWSWICYTWTISTNAFHLYVNTVDTTLSDTGETSAANLGAYVTSVSRDSGGQIAAAYHDNLVLTNYVPTTAERLRMMCMERGLMNDAQYSA